LVAGAFLIFGGKLSGKDSDSIKKDSSMREFSSSELVANEHEHHTFFRIGKSGLVEEIDALTGIVVAIQEDMTPLPRTSFVEHVVDGKTYLVQNTIDLAKSLGIKKQIPYSPVLGDLIVQKIVNGVAMSDLSKVPGFPDLHTLSIWRSKNSDFDLAIREARRVRAELMRDNALQVAESADGELSEIVAGKRLLVDTLKWAAEKDDPEIYSARQRVDATVTAMTMIVDTGIRRQDDEGVLDAEKVDGDDVESSEQSVRVGNDTDVVEGTVGDASGYPSSRLAGESVEGSGT